MIKKIFCICFSVFIIISSTIVPTLAYTPTNFDVSAEGAMLVSMDTGDVLYSKNIHKKLYPASLTKIMTALLLIENTPDLDIETITVSDNAVKSLLGTDSSIGGFKPGEQMTARQMLYNLLLSSANDGAIAIAEHVSGDVDSFIEIMNKRAGGLGMNDTHFVNTHGLYDANHYTTTYDMYLLTTEALKYSVFKDIVSTKRYSMPATNMNPAKTLSNSNMLIDASTVHYYKYANGVKTGYTDEAGRCLISTATKDGYSYICILMNSPVYAADKITKVRLEFGDTKKLFEWAFNDFEYKSVVNTDSIVGEVKVDMAWDVDHVSLVPQNSFSSIIPASADSSTVTLDLNLDSDTIDAPVEKGQVLGTAKVMFAGEEIGTVGVVAADSVQRSQILYGIRLFKNAMNSVWARLIIVILIAAIIIFIIACIVMNVRRKSHKRHVHNYKRF
ncbi:MAG: D-alanyl-D-alanine carboxypeptidase [Oscillospiraceae bacterium]|nr:D-alanyl-D-alanine carboxypeptidase [Oscillospiraceae bacterium]